ncbi:MAG: acyltransferase [Verrucomicrobiota bacterium]
MPTISTPEQLIGYVDSNGNKVIGEPKAFTRSSIMFASENCTLVIGKGANLDNCRMVFQSPRGRVEIGANSTVKAYIRCGTDSTVKIGARFSHTGGGVFSAAEGANLTIGDDCMFAIHLDIRADHAHPIFDRTTGNRLNVSRDVIIGDHVWLAPNVRVYPGAKIGAGTVIGADSIVTKEIPPHCVAIGRPAKVTRENIVWDKSHVCIRAPWKFDHVSDIPNMWKPDDDFEE